MNDDTARLLELQEIDERLRQLAAAQADCDREVASQDGQKAQLDQRQAALEAARVEARKKVDRGNLELNQLQEEISKLVKQQSDSRTNKEFQAFQNEIKLKEADRGPVEDRTLEAMEALEKVQAELGGLTGEAEALARQLEAVKARAAAARAELEKQAAGERQRREEAAARVPAELLRRYERLAKRHEGPVVLNVSAADKSCPGCRMNLTAQSLNLLMIDNETVACQACSRLLYLTNEQIAEVQAAQQ